MCNLVPVIRVTVFGATVVFANTAINAQECDPIETSKLLASDGSEGALFGNSIAMFGDTALIGAQADDNRANAAGAAYVYRYDGSHWVRGAKLLAADRTKEDYFGSAVALWRDTALIGASGDGYSGSAYVFRFDGQRWNEEVKLYASDGGEFDRFGEALALVGDTAIIGVRWDENENGMWAGSAYVFKYDGLEWVEDAKLLASDGVPADFFGTSVALSGKSVLVGAPVGYGMQPYAGSAYLYRYNGLQWVEDAKMTPSDGAEGDHFGTSVALLGDTALIGAPADEDNGPWTGSVYFFGYDGAEWVERGKLLASDGAEDDGFGWSIAISKDTALIGTRSEDDDGEYPGSTYVFRYDGTHWIEEAKLMASDGDGMDFFGRAVALQADVALIGAVGDDDLGAHSGATYIFDLNCPDCLNLNVENLVAGEVAELTITGGTPGGRAITVFGFEHGYSVIDDIYGTCATFLIKGMKQRRRVIGPSNRIFDADGKITFFLEIPSDKSGVRGLFQSAHRNTCPDECMSNLVEMVVG